MSNNRIPRGQCPSALQAGELEERASGCQERACAAPANVPLRLERHVGWNLNTGCEVQRKGMEGEGAEGKDRARRGQFQHH